MNATYFVRSPRWLSMMLVLSLMAWTRVGNAAPPLTTIHSFSAGFVNPDGANPNGLIQGKDGLLYGTTYQGGDNDQGAIFKITTSGTLTTLYSFSAIGSIPFFPYDGAYPVAGLIQGKDGNLYGTTWLGGATGDGSVFKITTSGAVTGLYSFDSDGSNIDGAYPVAGLIQGKDGNLYGTTSGGDDILGTVFKITTSGSLTTLYSFGETNTDGVYPSAVLIQGTDSNLYGTTAAGGRSGYGTIFKITTGGALTTLHTFTGTDGADPYAALIQGSDGNLYGTSEGGGANGDGTVFKITTSGALTTLYSFNWSDGADPYAALVQGSDGNLYGSAQLGSTSGAGTVFKITTGGALTTLHTFSGTDGLYPSAALVQGNDGNLYGTTYNGGNVSSTNYDSTTNGLGTVFQFGTDIASLSPNPVQAGTAFILTLHGSGFVKGAVVTWNGNTLKTTFGNANQLTAAVPATVNTLLSSYPGSAQIAVVNPDKATGSAALTITAPAAVLTTLAPSSLPADSKASTLTLIGQFFVPAAVANWNGAALPTTFVSATKLTATVPAADLATVGTAQVNVTDVNGGGTSNSLTFTITGVPALNLLAGSPSRDGSGNIVVPITLDNVGTAMADTLQITSSTLGIYGTTSSVPISLGNLGAGSSAGTTLTYSGSAGKKGQKVKLTVWGSYQAAGSSTTTNYSLSANIVLP